MTATYCTSDTLITPVTDETHKSLRTSEYLWILLQPQPNYERSQYAADALVQEAAA